MSIILVVNESSVTEKQANLFVADLLQNKNSSCENAGKDYVQNAVQKFLTLIYGCEDIRSVENSDKIVTMITKCVLAKKGDMVHIKHPERYLHYSKELLMFANFLICVVERGIEIVLQTNSEILWLQLRIAIKTGVINKDDLITYFINKDGNNPIKITLEQDGGCHNQPRSFFDTNGDQLSELFSF